MINDMKKVFITGASSGIGEYLAYAYAKQGYFVGLASRREDRLKNVASKCFEYGGDAKVYLLDVLDEDAGQKAIQDFIRLPGTVDSVFANAGIGNPDKLSSGRSDAMNQILSVNILGVTNVVMPFIPHFKEQKSGKIAVISSVASFRGLAHHSAYSGSKSSCTKYQPGMGYRPT